MTITTEKFRAVVGRDPVTDDLDRCNCPEVGKVGHFYCGWCDQCDMPRFMCAHIKIGGGGDGGHPQKGG